MDQVCYNGTFFPADNPILPLTNGSFKWGEGLFETIRVVDSTILYWNRHFKRLSRGLKLLNIHLSWSSLQLASLIMELCERNHCSQSARVRLSCFRDMNGQAGIAIEAFPIAVDSSAWKSQGLRLGLFDAGRKAADQFSALKSSSYLLFRMAERYSSSHHFDDVLVLNAHGRIAESSRANLFIVRDGILLTPSLAEGCIEGIMRSVIIDVSQEAGIKLIEKGITTEDILLADEVFLTSSIQGVRWVSSFEHRSYSFQLSFTLYSLLSSTNPDKCC